MARLVQASVQTSFLPPNQRHWQYLRSLSSYSSSPIDCRKTPVDLQTWQKGRKDDSKKKDRVHSSRGETLSGKEVPAIDWDEERDKDLWKKDGLQAVRERIRNAQKTYPDYEGVEPGGD